MCDDPSVILLVARARAHELLVAERHAALREAFTDLPSRCQRLTGMLTEDPPVPYAKISAELGIPIGSIGPTRSRCLDMLRRHPAITALIHAGPRRGGQRPGETAETVVVCPITQRSRIQIPPPLLKQQVTGPEDHLPGLAAACVQTDL